MPRTAIVVAAVVTLLAGSFVSAAGAAATTVASPPVEMSSACALKVGGLLRYVTSPTKCSSKLEIAVTIKPGPVKTCVLQSGFVYRTTGVCTVRGSTPRTLPPTSTNAYFCALKLLGTLRSVSSPTKCTKFELAVLVTPNNRAPVAGNDLIGADNVVVLNVLANDTDADGHALAITSITADPDLCGAPAITPDGLGISYDASEAYSNCAFFEGDTETFSYTVSDGHGGSDTATVTVVLFDFSRDFASLCIPLILSSTSVAPGGLITASGTAVWPSATITMVLNGSVVLGTTTSAPGPIPTPLDPTSHSFWSTTVTIPANTPPGPATIQAFQFISPTQPNGCPAQVAGITIT